MIRAFAGRAAARRHDQADEARPADDTIEDRVFLSYTLLFSALLATFMISLEYAVTNPSLLALWS